MTEVPLPPPADQPQPGPGPVSAPPEQGQGVDPALLAAVNTAQTPEQYAAAAKAAGLTADAEQAAAAGAAPVVPPDYGAMLEQFQKDQQAQITKIKADFEAQLAALQAGIPASTTAPGVGEARNLSDGLKVLATSYPQAGRVAPLAKAAGALADAVADKGDGAAVATPDTSLVTRAVATFRRFRAANPQLETGIFEHAAQVLEDALEL
jgi:hypothetical protein